MYASLKTKKKKKISCGGYVDGSGGASDATSFSLALKGGRAKRLAACKLRKVDVDPPAEETAVYLYLSDGWPWH